MLENSCTGEKVYNLTVECNDLIFHVGIDSGGSFRRAGAGAQVQGEGLDAGKCVL